MEITEKETEAIDEMAIILIREGYLQEKDRNWTERIRARWALRVGVPQATVKGIKERAATPA